MKIAIELEADMGRVEVAGRTLILKIKMHDYQVRSGLSELGCLAWLGTSKFTGLMADV